MPNDRVHTSPSIRKTAPIAPAAACVRWTSWRAGRTIFSRRIWDTAIPLGVSARSSAVSLRGSRGEEAVISVSVCLREFTAMKRAACTRPSKFLERLHADPERARGYELFVYPVINPWGYVEGSRWTRSGLDLNRQFWKGSEEIEVQILERQLRKLNFNGIIALHSDDTSEGLYGFVKGHELTRHVLEPALEEAGRILPRNFDKSIDNFEANNGIIEKGYDGILTAPPEQKPRPFEIVFETPHHAALDKQS